MDRRILFSTYLLSARFKSGRDNQFLDQFNAADSDLFPLLVTFFNDLYQTPRDSVGDGARTTTLRFTLTEPVKVDSVNRIIYGYFESGFTGQKLTIKDNTDRSTAFKGDKKRHTSVNDLFFFIRMPMRSREAYCILQRRSHYGLKTAFHTEFKKWVVNLGFIDTTIDLKPSLPGSVFYKMISDGKLKQIDFIINRLPKTYDQLHERDLGDDAEKGKFVSSLQSPFSLSDYWKDFIRHHYLLDFKNSNVTIDPRVEEYQEIAFQLELNGKIKKFYARQKSKTLPDLDVTDGLEFIDEEPMIDSLVQKSQETISDVFGKTAVEIFLTPMPVDIDVDTLKNPIELGKNFEASKKVKKRHKKDAIKSDQYQPDSAEASTNIP